jgi:uncharacterized protein
MAENTTDKHNPLISVQEFPDDGKLQIIHGYGGGQFRIAGQTYDGAQFVLPRLTLGWQVTSLEDVTVEAITDRLATGKNSGILEGQDGQMTELVILGVGARADSHLLQLARALKEKNIRLEVMTTAAACRTWNVLLTEGRSAAVGLLPVD